MVTIFCNHSSAQHSQMLKAKQLRMISLIDPIGSYHTLTSQPPLNEWIHAIFTLGWLCMFGNNLLLRNLNSQPETLTIKFRTTHVGNIMTKYFRWITFCYAWCMINILYSCIEILYPAGHNEIHTGIFDTKYSNR